MILLKDWKPSRRSVTASGPQAPVRSTHSSPLSWGGMFIRRLLLSASRRRRVQQQAFTPPLLSSSSYQVSRCMSSSSSSAAPPASPPPVPPPATPPATTPPPPANSKPILIRIPSSSSRKRTPSFASFASIAIHRALILNQLHKHLDKVSLPDSFRGLPLYQSLIFFYDCFRTILSI